MGGPSGWDGEPLKESILFLRPSGWGEGPVWREGAEQGDLGPPEEGPRGQEEEDVCHKKDIRGNFINSQVVKITRIH